MTSTDATSSDRVTFRRLLNYLQEQRDPLAQRLAAVIAVAIAFEDLHRELLYRFDQVRALGYRRPVPVKHVTLAATTKLAPLADALTGTLSAHGAILPRSIADAVHRFSLAAAPMAGARTGADLVSALIGHHERVQAGKLDASRQPKLPWVELRGSDVVIAPRYALDAIPDEPSSTRFTHPYRVEQFSDLLGEAGARETAP